MIRSRFKEPKTNEKPFLKSLRDFPCTFCKWAPPSEASHIRLGQHAGTGQKSKLALPSCRACHLKLHRGEKTFFGDKLDYYTEMATEVRAAYPDRDKMGWILLGSKR